MKRHLFITALMMLSAIAMAQNTKKVAILDIVDRENKVVYGVEFMLRSYLTDAINRTPGYEGYDRVDMASIIGEHNFQRTGLVSDAQIKKLGEMTGASYIILAEAAMLGADNIIINAKIIDVETARIVNTARPKMSSTRDTNSMTKACAELAIELLGMTSETRSGNSGRTEGNANARNSSKGVFSVGPSTKVYFSKGNLQYQASTNTWRFAEHQWDVIGDANSSISSYNSRWIDLFGWGTGKNPTKSSTDDGDYGSFSDWGNNSISNGEGKSWFTLTKVEWDYVFNSRSTNSGIRYAKAVVNGVNGVILLPDNWSTSYYTLSGTNNSGASFTSNRVSQTTWAEKFESNGAVFLPAAGGRYGTNADFFSPGGYYWSATVCNSDDAYLLGFDESNPITALCDGRSDGLSVRLVCCAED